MPKAGENVDKVQQYTDDFAETKKRLEEARQRRLDEKRKQEVRRGCHIPHIFLAIQHFYLQVAKKLQRSMSKENAAETAAAMVEAERDRRNRKSGTPPKQQQKEERTPVKHKTPDKKMKKKLTMEDLEDPGSDEDWSGNETPNRLEFLKIICYFLSCVPSS